MTAPFDDSWAACDFVDLWLDDVEAGVERPLGEYLQRFPGHEETVAREFLELCDQLRASRAPEPGGQRLGPYRIVRELGRGGQGTVWMADDPRLGRRVAVKVLDSAAGRWSEARRRRLRREARVLSRLEHPGICRILDADLDGERPYLVMRFVEGETLQARLERARAAPRPRPPATAEEVHAELSMVERAARAAHAAHEAGVVHRDIKPGNLMLEPDGNPVLLDLGLALQTDEGSAALTAPGEVMGTLAYMAPEQLEGTAQRVDRRADVYALGATLYECLTLRQPFAGESTGALREAILRGGPRDAGAHNPALPRDVRVVLDKALDRDPARRYPDALALAQDLGRIRAHEPIAARPAGPGLLLRRWTQRHPTVAVAGSVAAVLLAIGLAVTLTLYVRLAAQRERQGWIAQSHRALTLADRDPGGALTLAVEAARRAPHADTHTGLLQVLGACWEARRSAPEGARDDTPLHEATTRLVRAGDEVLLATARGEDGIELGALHGDGPALTVDPVPGARCTLASGPEDGQLLVGGADGSVALLEARSGATLWRGRGAGGRVWWLEAADDGRRVVSCEEGGAFCVFDLGAPDAPPWIGRHPGVTVARFAPGGGSLVTMTGQPGPGRPQDLPGVQVWDVPGRSLRHCLREPTSWVRWAGWSPAGERLVVACDDGVARVWDVATGERLAALPHDDRVWWAEFTPGGDAVVTATMGAVVVWDPERAARTATVESFLGRPVVHGSFAPDGDRLAVVAWDRTLQVLDVADWQPLRRHVGFADQPKRVAWVTGRWLDTETVRGQGYVWYGSERPFLQVLDGHRERVVRARFDRDGERVLTVSHDGTARLWDADTGRCLQVLGEGSAPLADAVLSPDGRRTGIAAADGRIEVREVASGRRSWRSSLAGPAFGVRFTADGGALVAVGKDGEVAVWDPSGAERLRTRAGGAELEVHAAALRPGEPVLALGGDDRRVRLLDLRTGRIAFASDPWPERVELDPLQRVFDLAFGPGGAPWAACEDLAVRSWSGGAVRELSLGYTPGRIAFDPAGRHLLVGAQWSGGILRYDPATLEPRPWSDPADAHDNTITALEVAPGGAFALSASKDGTARLWDLRRGRLHLVCRGHGDMVLDAAFDGEGARIVTASADGTARIWPVRPLEVAERVLPRRSRRH